MTTIPNSDKSEAITLRCSAELKRAVRIRAAELNTTIEDLCAELLSRGLGKPEDKRRTA